MSGTVMERCAVCGGEFSAKRIHIEGKPYHPGCAVVSWPPHTHEDAARISAQIVWLREALRALVNAAEPWTLSDEELAHAVNDARQALALTPG